jgi:hypothetical protein
MNLLKQQIVQRLEVIPNEKLKDVLSTLNYLA